MQPSRPGPVDQQLGEFGVGARLTGLVGGELSQVGKLLEQVSSWAQLGRRNRFAVDMEAGGAIEKPGAAVELQTSAAACLEKACFVESRRGIKKNIRRGLGEKAPDEIIHRHCSGPPVECPVLHLPMQVNRNLRSACGGGATAIAKAGVRSTWRICGVSKELAQKLLS